MRCRARRWSCPCLARCKRSAVLFLPAYFSVNAPLRHAMKGLEFAESYAKGQVRAEVISFAVACERGNHASWRRLTSSATMEATQERIASIVAELVKRLQ